MKKIEVGICGLGLIGGSIAWALKASKSVDKIVGIDINEDNYKAAIESGVISAEMPNNCTAFVNCDVVFICVPVNVVAKQAAEIRNVSNALLTDAGSTKCEILNEIKNLGIEGFIGGHPMSGSERAGFNAAQAVLLQNAIYPIVPYENSDEQQVQMLKDLVFEMNAVPLIMSAKEHDEVVAAISHLPHVVASALCVKGSRMAEQDEKIKALAAGGFKDLTRIASSDENLWSEILVSSRQMLLPEVEDFINVLEKFKNLLLNVDKKGIADFIKSGKDFRNSINISGKGILFGFPEIKIDVADKPGEIARIATLLSSNGINIQNINIQNNRDYEGGVMRITLQDEQSAELARKILEDL